jgi:hypothetical protein
MSNLSANEMRKVLISMYPNGTKWRLRVNKMSDSQVLAIYLRKVLNRNNAIDKR